MNFLFIGNTSGRTLRVCVLGLLIGALLAIISVIRDDTTPKEPVGVVYGVIAAPLPEEAHKQEVARYLAAKYKRQLTVVRSYVDLAWHESAKYPRVEPELILAVIQKESSFKYTASNRYGAEGLMQVVRRWHPEKIGRTESLKDPKVNIRVGAQILRQYIQEAGDLEQALAKYSGKAEGYADFVIREKEVLQAI